MPRANDASTGRHGRHLCGQLCMFILLDRWDSSLSRLGLLALSRRGSWTSLFSSKNWYFPETTQPGYPRCCGRPEDPGSAGRPLPRASRTVRLCFSSRSVLEKYCWQVSHLYGFSPLCDALVSLHVVLLDELCLHWSRPEGLLAAVDLLVPLQQVLLDEACLHWRTGKGRSPVWMRTCRRRW